MVLVLFFSGIRLLIFFMDGVPDGLIQALVHSLLCIGSLNLVFLLVKCLVGKDELIAQVLDLDDIALSFKTIDRNVPH